MNTKLMMDYLAALDQNNNREWFHANKEWYLNAKTEFEQLVTAMMVAVQAFDANIPFAPAKELTFRLMRDTRFSHDKRPYNASFRAHIGRAGKMPIPCDYYMTLKPGNQSFIGGGLFASMFPDATQRVRNAIAEHGDAFGEIVETLGFEIKGDALKRVPKDFDPNLPQAEYLKNKSWYLEVNVSDALILDPSAFVPEAARMFEQMKPLNDFLNRALEGFVMPSRK